MSATPTLFHQIPSAVASARRPGKRARQRLDLGLLFGIAVTAAAVAAAAVWTGAGAEYFFQPRGAVMVLGGTLGVWILTTPARALGRAAKRILSLLVRRPDPVPGLQEEILRFSRVARFKGLAGVEDSIPEVSDDFLRESLRLALEVENRLQLEEILHTRIRMQERLGEESARTLEMAGSFAPTLGILGTVVGLIDVLRNFSDLGSVGLGIGTAFLSTLYGLGLANLLLLPAAHRIRARVAEEAAVQELIAEGVLCLYDQSHPALAEQRLAAYTGTSKRRSKPRREKVDADEGQTA